MNITSFKKITPNFVLTGLRNLRARSYRFLDNRGGAVRSMNYLGFRLFYLRGGGVTDRIRFGNLNRIYEPEFCEAIKSSLEKFNDPVFLDIGANVGLISLYVIRHIPKVKIFAFEPGPLQFDILNQTISANGLSDKINLSNQALSDKTGQAEFAVHINAGNTSGDGFQDTGRGGETKKISVQTVTLDDWWANKGKPNISVVKIDTEGAELIILRGAEEFLRTVRPIIFLEISVKNLQAYPYTHLDIFRWFKAHNYSVCSLSGANLTEESFETAVKTEDSFMAKPRN